MTLPEVVLWNSLRGGKLGQLRFRRQHPAGVHILDFFCAPALLAVEVDGEGHAHPDQLRHDAARDAWFASQGVQTLRFAASDELDEEALHEILARILTTAVARLAPPPRWRRGPPPP